MKNPPEPNEQPDRSVHPYSGLTPECILDALESVGFRGDGRLLALNSYENRVYQVWLEEDTPRAGSPVVVAKFYRPGRWTDAQILEEHSFCSELVADEIPVVAPLGGEAADPGGSEGAGASGSAGGSGGSGLPSGTLHHFQGYRFAVYPRQGGRAPELESPETLERIGRFLGRIHARGAVHAFQTRPALDAQTFGHEPRDWLAAHGVIPAALREPWKAAIDQCLQAVDAAWERAQPLRLLRLHGDCHAGNLLWTDAGPHFVDFDDARQGPAIQDLWMLLAGDRATMTRSLSEVLAGYEDFADFDRRELGLIEPLRTLRLIHYSAWIARRWDDPAFPAAFPWFGTERYWQDRILELREQLGAMSEAPLIV